jgi:hypothetical protein
LTDGAVGGLSAGALALSGGIFPYRNSSTQSFAEDNFETVAVHDQSKKQMIKH